MSAGAFADSLKRPRQQVAIKLGCVLHDARLHAGLTVRAVEKLTGISNAYVSQMESGYIAEPSPHLLKKLSKAYRVPYGKLFDAAGYPRP
jgi:transcriptional regulator with XRE-family HTH domain